MPDELISPGVAVATVELSAPATLKEAEESQASQTTISEYLESLLVTVILALFGTSFVVQAFKIPSPSMEKTLLVGDHLLVNKFIFGGRGRWYDRASALPRIAARRHHRFQVPLSGSSSFRETRDWVAGRPPESCGSAGLCQRKSFERALRRPRLRVWK